MGKLAIAALNSCNKGIELNFAVIAAFTSWYVCSRSAGYIFLDKCYGTQDDSVAATKSSSESTASCQDSDTCNLEVFSYSGVAYHSLKWAVTKYVFSLRPTPIALPVSLNTSWLPAFFSEYWLYYWTDFAHSPAFFPDCYRLFHLLPLFRSFPSMHVRV